MNRQTTAFIDLLTYILIGPLLVFMLLSAGLAGYLATTKLANRLSGPGGQSIAATTYRQVGLPPAQPVAAVTERERAPEQAEPAASLTVVLVLYDKQDNVVNFGHESLLSQSSAGADSPLEFEVCVDALKQSVGRFDLKAWGR